MDFKTQINKVLSEDLDDKMPHLIASLTQKKSKWEGDDPEAFIRLIAQFDPTGNQAKYMNWIIGQVKRANIKLPEDGSRLHDALEFFLKHRNKANWPGKRDLNQYKNWRTIEDLMWELGGKEEELKTKGEQAREIKTKGARWVFGMIIPVIMYYDDKGKIIKSDEIKSRREAGLPIIKKNVDLEYRLLEVATPEALYEYGRGTRWCTAAKDNTYSEYYLKKGPLYIGFRGKEKFFQADNDFAEFMDVKDSGLYTLSPATDFFLAHVAQELPNTRPGIAKLRASAPDYNDRPEIIQ